MQSVPSQHSFQVPATSGSTTAAKMIEGGFIELQEFLQGFIRDVSKQLQTLSTVEDIHQWASSALPSFSAQADRRAAVLREVVLANLVTPHSPMSNLLGPGGATGTSANLATGSQHFVFDMMSPRTQRVQSIDTLDPYLGGGSSRTASMRGMGGVQNVVGSHSGNREGTGTGSESDHAGSQQAVATSPQSNMSRPASFSNRIGSFAKKYVNGIDVPMLKDEASGAVVDALNDTYSLASRGSWRRRGGPPSMYSLQHGAASAISLMGNNNGGNNNNNLMLNDIKRRAYLSFVHLEGMPNLNIESDAQELRTKFSRPSKRHTAVFRDKADLESLLDECNLPQIHDINSLEFNVFEEYQKYGDHAFTVVVMNVILKYTFVTGFRLNIPSLLTFVRTVQSFYRSENPFHNGLHAADVVQTTHLYLCQRDVKENFSDVELFSLLMAAMCIDVGHLGVNNQFLTKTRHPLATLFSDTSPMEAMSSALTFCILDDPDCNIFLGSPVWDRELDNEFRGLVADLILRSDDCEHASMCSDIDEILARGIVGEGAVPQLLAAVLHAADVSYMCKPKHIYMEWAFRFIAENYRQGDAEAEFIEMYRDAHPQVDLSEARWLLVSKLCDRQAMTAPELERSIMEHVVLPFITLLQPFLPSIWIERLEANYRYLVEDEDEKTIVIQNGVQEQLWKKGVLSSWSDVSPASGKNFLQVIRNWIAAELPEGDGADVQQPSKLAEGNFTPAPTDPFAASSHPSVVSEGEDKGSGSGGPSQTIPQANLLRVQKDQQPSLTPVGSTSNNMKKRLSVTQQAPSAPPTIAQGLTSVHVLAGEMLKHMHTLLHAGVPGSWDASREGAIFAHEWVKLLRTLETQENGPSLLSALSASTLSQLRSTLSNGSSTAPLGAGSTPEEAESLAVIEVLRDMNSPFAHFKPAKPSAALSSNAQAGGGNQTNHENSSATTGEAPGRGMMRRESVSDLTVLNSPFACAVLLTQMWWVLYGMVEDAVRGSSHEPRDDMATPVEPGLVRHGSDDELSGSQSGRRPPMLTPKAAAANYASHASRKRSLDDSLNNPNSTSDISNPAHQARHVITVTGSTDALPPLPSTPRRDSTKPTDDGPAATAPHTVTASVAACPAPQPPLTAPPSSTMNRQHKDAEASSPSGIVAPTPPLGAAPASPSPAATQAIRDIMQSTGTGGSARRTSRSDSVVAGGPQNAGVTGGTQEVPDPSPLKYVLQQRRTSRSK